MTDQVKAEADKTAEFASADDVLALAGVREYKPTPVPGIKLPVRIQSLFAGERDAFEQSCVDQRGDSQRTNMVGARARLVALTAVDGKGRTLFTEADVERLNQINSAAVQKIWDVATALSGIGNKDIDELTRPFVKTDTTD